MLACLCGQKLWKRHCQIEQCDKTRPQTFNLSAHTHPDSYEYTCIDVFTCKYQLAGMKECAYANMLSTHIQPSSLFDQLSMVSLSVFLIHSFLLVGLQVLRHLLHRFWHFSAFNLYISCTVRRFFSPYHDIYVNDPRLWIPIETWSVQSCV